MLPIVMEFNQEATGEKFKAIAEAMGVDTAGMNQAEYRKAAIDAVRQLSTDVGIPTKLEVLKEEDLDFLAQSAADACTPAIRKRLPSTITKRCSAKLCNVETLRGCLSF